MTQAKKFEGAWYGNGKIWINVSFAKTAADYNGGASPHEGQVWVYDPAAQRITLVFRNAPGGLFDAPDNLVVSPYGGAFLCEDGDGDCYIIGLDGANQGFAFAKNRIWTPGEYAEFTGACFHLTASSCSSTRSSWHHLCDHRTVVRRTSPESPLVVMMPVAAAAVLVGGMVAFRRCGERVDVSPAWSDNRGTGVE